METKQDKRLMDELFDSPVSQLFVLVGKSFKGKSYFIRYLLTDRILNAGWKFGLVFTKSKYNNDYDFLPDDKIIEGYQEDILEKYFDNLKNIKKSKKKIPQNFIIFDDLIGVLKNQSDFFNNFISTHRHTNTNVLIAVQYLTGKNAISPIMREQTSHAILFNSRTRRTLENLYETYGGLFDSYDEFKEYFMNATKEPYTAMLYSERIDDINNNYKTIMAPADYPKMNFKF